MIGLIGHEILAGWCKYWLLLVVSRCGTALFVILLLGCCRVYLFEIDDVCYNSCATMTSTSKKWPFWIRKNSHNVWEWNKTSPSRHGTCTIMYWYLQLRLIKFLKVNINYPSCTIMLIQIHLNPLFEQVESSSPAENRQLLLRIQRISSLWQEMWKLWLRPSTGKDYQICFSAIYCLFGGDVVMKFSMAIHCGWGFCMVLLHCSPVFLCRASLTATIVQWVFRTPELSQCPIDSRWVMWQSNWPI